MINLHCPNCCALMTKDFEGQSTPKCSRCGAVFRIEHPPLTMAKGLPLTTQSIRVIAEAT